MKEFPKNYNFSESEKKLQQFWQEKQELVDPQSQPGHAVWAARQSAMWGSMAIQAGSKFTALLESDPPPEFAKVLLQPKQVDNIV